MSMEVKGSPEPLPIGMWCREAPMDEGGGCGKRNCGRLRDEANGWRSDRVSVTSTVYPRNLQVHPLPWNFLGLNREGECTPERLVKMTREGDVVLVYMEGNPAFFARIESITADVKPGWYQMKMLVLQVPLMVVSWILRDVYINGEEFTMGGRPVRVVRVVTPQEEELESDREESEQKEMTTSQKDVASKPAIPEKGNVVSMFDRKKKDHSP